MEVDGLADELHRQKEESRQQHEELALLVNKLTQADAQLLKVSRVCKVALTMVHWNHILYL